MGVKIIFWNTARGSSLPSERFEAMFENCLALSLLEPHLIVLCEALKKTEEAFNAKGGIPFYKILKPSGTDVSGDHTLRYLILARKDTKCTATYCGTKFSRPAVHITINAFSVMAIHAPSVTQSVKPQTNALTHALTNTSTNTVSTPSLQKPMAIFGDFNVDALSGGKRNKFVDDLSAEFAKIFDVKGKLVPKYDEKYPTRGKKVLDWAMVDPDFVSAVTVSVAGAESVKTKPLQLKLPPGSVLGKRALRPTGAARNLKRGPKNSRDDDDPDWTAPITSTEKSDHEAILIEFK